MRGALAFVFVLGSVGCAEAPPPPEASSSSTPAATATAPAPAVTPAAPAKPKCTLDGLYKPETHPSQEAAQAAVVAIVKGWTPECRREAFDAECAKRCNSFPSDMLIAAAPREEARALRGERIARNRAAIAKYNAITMRVEGLHAYAMRSRSLPRGVSEDCMPRMRADFARADALRTELDAQLPELPFGSVGARSWIANLRSCLDCSDDRSGCDSALEERALHLEARKSWEDELKADERALK